jgi:hypothetical protein
MRAAQQDVSGQQIGMANLSRLIPTAIAIGLFSTAFYVHILAREVASWPTTVGKLDAKLITGYGAGTAAEAGNSDHYYAVSARYSYQVGAKTFAGSNVRVWDMSVNSRAEAESYWKDNRVGSAVVVFYNPSNLEQSYLSAAYPVAPVCLLSLGALMSAGIAIFWRQLSRLLQDWFVSRETGGASL